MSDVPVYAFTYVPASGHDALMCGTCGALVGNRDQHITWHVLGERRA